MAIEIQFVRSSGFYILSSIIPMILLVILSFVSFLLTTDSNVMKLGIPVCSFLGVLFLMVSINIGLPKISYLIGINLFLFFHFETFTVKKSETSLYLQSNYEITFHYYPLNSVASRNKFLLEKTSSAQLFFFNKVANPFFVNRFGKSCTVL